MRINPKVGQAVLAFARSCSDNARLPHRQKAKTFRTPDAGPQFQPGGENGLSDSFRWRELRGRAGEHRLPHPAGSLQIPRHQEF
jgi:hypothetical protein